MLFYKLYYHNDDGLRKITSNYRAPHVALGAVFACTTRQKEAPPAPVAIISADRALRPPRKWGHLRKITPFHVIG